MKKGFVIDTSLCVDCRACMAACIIENSWESKARSVRSTNPNGNNSFPVVNLSLACNHCLTAACLNSCPAKAYYRTAPDGPVIINGENCIGCGYCTWNCPYGAPALNSKGFIDKCHLCNHRLAEGISPACTNACPTGALSYGEIDYEQGNRPVWFPDKGLEPQVLFAEGSLPQEPVVIPEEEKTKTIPKEDYSGTPPTTHWSLVVFTTILPVPVAIAVKNYFGGSSDGALLSFLLAVLAGILSLFHLKKPLRAHRAILNLKKSHVSREIGMLLLFSGLTLMSVISGSNIFYGLSAVSGLLLLWFVDNVYSAVDKGNSPSLSSGQTFLSGLMIAAFLLDRTLAFSFIALLRIFITLISIKSLDNKYRLISLSRIILMVPAFTFSFGLVQDFYFIPFLALCAGELADRLIFYKRLKVLHIDSELITYRIQNEKERSK